MQFQPFFTTCLDEQQIKDEYRRLCRLHHPDLHTAGCSPEQTAAATRKMQEINAAYSIAMDQAVRRAKPNFTESQYDASATVAELIRQAIEAIIRFDNISIEICGAWVWVSGDTRPIKEALKDAGYKWAPRKDGQPWYFAGVPSMNRRRKYSLDEIRNRYGSERVEKDEARSRGSFAA
jgi:curved DNA-binding protein CbpA